MAKPKKLKPYPNKASMHSYFMQAIEPTSPEINAAFPEYHPMWIIQSQSKTVSADRFKYMREVMLNITRHQCAAYLRVSESAVRRWENNSIAVPFMAFELLRLVFESAHFRLSHTDWQGWFVNKQGRLVSSDNKNLSFLPHELLYVHQIHQQKSFYESEYKRLKNEVAPLKAEIEELKAAGGNSGLLDELKAIESRLAELSSRISNNKVVRIGKPKVEVKAA